MTKFFLLDDDVSVTGILKIIIEENNLGKVLARSSDPVDALDDFLYIAPDVVLVDLLMPGMDGITFVKKARRLLPQTSFIMLSQVTSKDMIAKAYEAGITFFIQKPVNAKEVMSVIANVEESRYLSQTMGQIKNLFQDNNLGGTRQTSPSKAEGKNTESASNETLQRIRSLLGDLGILGITGCDDLITLVSYFCEHEEEMEKVTIKEACAHYTDHPKSMEQRIRRAAAAGMTNLAHLGLEDFASEIFTQYAGRLYPFEQVRKEMDFIRGKSELHGNVRMKQFLAAMVNFCR